MHISPYLEKISGNRIKIKHINVSNTFCVWSEKQPGKIPMNFKHFYFPLISMALQQH